MIVPNPKRQKAALKTLDDLFSNPQSVFVIHYSCESFYDRKDGRSPRITSIALRNLASAQTRSFSIHQLAEINGTPLGKIEQHYDKLEEEMLSKFFSHIAGYQGVRYLHWNMRDSNYGFQAIEHRFRTLRKTEDCLHVVDDSQKVDLSRLLQDVYGLDYIGHPRLEELLSKNNIVRRDFLNGKEEAEAFENQSFASLHQSTLRKVDILGNLALLAHDRRLKTNTTWWGMRGGRITACLNWIGEHPMVVVFGLVLTAASILIAIIK